jgi:hypothetical protein
MKVNKKGQQLSLRLNLVPTESCLTSMNPSFAEGISDEFNQLPEVLEISSDHNK